MFSRAIMKVVTRVMSAWNASTCRSNISSAYSRNVSGTPAGRSGTAKSLLVDSARDDALLDVTNRPEIFVELRAVVSAEPARQSRAISWDSPSRMLRSSLTRATAVPPRCRRCRTAARTRTGDSSRPAAAWSASSTTASSCRRTRSHGRRRRRRRCGRRRPRATDSFESRQISSAIIWSTVVPACTSAPSVCFGCTELMNAGAARGCWPPVSPWSVAG